MSRLVLTQITIKKERSISSTTWYYLLQPSNASAPDATNYGNPPPIYSDTGYSGWSTTEPTYTIGDNRVLYVMVQTLYSDGTFSYSTPTTSSSYEAAKDAYNEAIEAEATISEFEDLGLKRGYIWDNMTYVAAHDDIPEYPVGSYIASGYLNAGNRTINRANSNTYGLNTWISTGGIKLRFNAIKLMQLTTSNLEFYYPSTSSQQKKAISLGTNNAVNSLAFYGFNNDNKTMELTNSALKFYDPANGTTEQAVLDTNGLVLQKGGVKAGTVGENGYVYLSTINHPLSYIKTTDTEIDSDKTYYTYNSNTDTYAVVETPVVDNIATYYEYTYPLVNNASKNNWRQLIGTKFGVDSEGNLYASNVNISGAINATSLTIGDSGYNAIDAINISGYSIEIEIDSTNASDSNHVLLYPHLYHNGEEVERVFTAATTYDANETYYTLDETTNVYTIVENSTASDIDSYYTSNLDYINFIWYLNNSSIGTRGDADDGHIEVTYDDYCRVVYTFEDGAVEGATDVQTVLVDPSKYITRISDSGITVHPEVLSAASHYTQIDGNGLYIKELLGSNINTSSDTTLASFTSSGITIGDTSQNYALFDSDSFDIYHDTTEIAHFGYGNGNAQSGIDTAPYYTIGYRRTRQTEYDSTATYKIGKHVVYDGVEYVCIADIDTPMEWDSSYWTIAIGNYSIVAGITATACGFGSFSTGGTAIGMCSHSEGFETIALDSQSHAEGSMTLAGGYSSHAEGFCTSAKGMYSHAQNSWTKASSRSQTAIGEYNNNQSYNLFEIGNGTDDDNRSNALAVDRNGNVVASGQIKGSVETVEITTFATDGIGNAMWTVYDNSTVPTLRICGNVVTLTGALRNVTAGTYPTTAVAMFSIPEAYAPPQSLVSVQHSSNAYRYAMRINSSGSVTMERDGYGTTYPTITSGWFPFHVVWIIE